MSGIERKIYKKPKITSKKIKINYFLTDMKFYNNVENLLIPNVFASGCGC